ncbi:hypothetical protein, partial [Pedobacter suwonensis]|uniref:hypothetical protein n=1 Tax=Pedobacter suwonensis TaxID=332999 RepID=UPI003D05A0ED
GFQSWLKFFRQKVPGTSVCPQSKVDEFIGENRVSGDGFHPNRQVYVYLTVSENGKDIKNIIVDAETKKVLFKSEPLIKR